MNIGFVTQEVPYLPARDGYRICAGNILKELSRTHHVDLVTLAGREDRDSLSWVRNYAASVELIPPQSFSLIQRGRSFLHSAVSGRPLNYRADLRAAVARLMREKNWDVIHVEGSFAGSLLPDNLPVPRILAVHDSWTLRCREIMASTKDPREWLLYLALRVCEARTERLVYPLFDVCTFVARADAEEVQRIVPGLRTEVVSNGVDADYFYPMPDAKQARTIVFHGNLSYTPNIDAALYFVNKILPLITQQLPEVTFHLIGANPVSDILALADRPGIRIPANVPDLRTAVSMAEVYVAPVQFGTGMKNKILEAMALGLAIVATPVAVSAISCVPGTHVLIADDPASFAAQTVNLLLHPKVGMAMGARARELVVKEYSWTSRARQYEVLYGELISRRPSARVVGTVR
jgi:polysaccharide biosynthesis protein PslH